jgi:hypothetical protein
MPTGDRSHRALARLTRYLIAKAIIEALLVGALASGFYLTAFNPYFRGAVDEANAQRVSGWVVNQRKPDMRVEVHLYIDGRFAASRVADLSRTDMKTTGRARDEHHGFSFDTPPLDRGEHEARVYVAQESGAGARRALLLIGKPVRFSVETGETSTGLNLTTQGTAPR